MNKIVLLLCCLFSCHFLTAQHLVVNGNIVTNESSPEGAKVSIIKNGDKIDEQVITKKGRFDLKLALNADYKITFSKGGYVTKTVSVNTEVPEESIEANPDFPPVKLIINLLPHMDGVDLSVFDQPIAILAYSPELDDFTFDKEYAEKNKNRVAQAEQELKRKFADRGAAANARAYKLLLSDADSLFSQKKYREAREKYIAATRLNTEDSYPTRKIREIDTILSTLAQQEADRKKHEADQHAAYQKAIAAADQTFNAREYTKSITFYRQALEIKAQETYPKEMIAKAEQALAELQKKEAAEAERKRLEEERINGLKNRYTLLIVEADSAFRKGNYALAKLRYTDADRLNLNEVYPQKQITAINKIINSSQYRTKLAEYNKNKTLAEKSMQQNNYAGAKVYFQKALSILSIDQEAIEQKIAEIDRLMEASRLAEIEKNYKENIEKADKAYAEKAYAVARFYYKKALEIKIGDPYATGHLQEIEKRIGERQSKEAEL